MSSLNDFPNIFKLLKVTDWSDEKVKIDGTEELTKVKKQGTEAENLRGKDEGSIAGQARYLGEDKTSANYDACENKIPNYDENDNITNEDRITYEGETYADYYAYEDEIHSNSDDNDNVTDKYCITDEDETHADHAACEIEMCGNCKENANVTAEDIITYEERYLDEDEINAIYDAWEIEIYGAYYTDEHDRAQERRMYEYQMEVYENQMEVYANYEECGDEIDVDENYTGKERMADEKIYMYEEETIADYDACEVEIEPKHDENDNATIEDIITYKEKYFIKDDRTSEEEYYMKEHETDTDQDEVESEAYGDCDLEENSINDRTSDEEYYMNDEETYTDQDGSKSEAYGDCDLGENVIKDDRTLDEEYYLKEQETHTDQDEGESDAYSDCDSEENFIKDDRDSDEKHYRKEQKTFTDQVRGKSEANDDCDLEENVINSNRTSDKEYYMKEPETYIDQDGGKSDTYVSCDSIRKGSDEGNVFKEYNNLQLHLFDIFQRLVSKLALDFNLQETAIKNAIDHLNYNFLIVVEGKVPTELDFNDMNNCVGYLHRFAPCHASMVLNVTIKLLKSLPVEMSGILTVNNQLNIVSVGSGPGNDLVGFLCAFHDQHLKLNHLDISIIDKMSGWHHVFNNIVQILKKDVPLGRVFREVPEITTSFFKADLEHSTLWCNDMISKLENADIVLLVKVLSNIPEENKFRALEDIVVRMKLGAVLIFIDCPIPSEEFSAMNSLETIYKTKIQHFCLRHKVKNFDHYNITVCRAAAHIFCKTKLKESKNETERK